MHEYGHFDDAKREYVITDPFTPAPWINYLGNTRLTAFISQQAGGLTFYRDPQTRRISRYHYLATPPDRPGFYVYVKDRETGALWNPHMAPTGTKLEFYECRHGLGYTRFIGRRDGVEAEVRYFIPPQADIMVWRISLRNLTSAPKRLTICSYLEFSLLEFMRETWWCYLKNQVGFECDPAARWIKYIYHAFQAPFTPAIFLTCTAPVTGYECARDAFCGPEGSLERPAALTGRGFTGSQLAGGGGHGCGVLGTDLELPAGGVKEMAYVLGVADDWSAATKLKETFSDLATLDAAGATLADYWQRKTGAIQVATGDANLNRMVNVWNPLNCQVALERTRDISTDHMGLDGMRYRDTMQDALAVANFDPDFARERIRLIFGVQSRDGRGCFAFYPFNNLPIVDNPARSDNTVWPIFTVANLVNETGDLSFFEERIPYRDGGEGSVYEHILVGLKYIHDRRGPHGLPLLAHADWNDSLAIFHDERAESVMLGMQWVYAARLFRDYAAQLGRQSDVEWCERLAAEMTEALNTDAVWDGAWYRRLLLSNGMNIGSDRRPQGKIYLESQVWSVISGVGRDGRGRQAMDAVRERLDTRRGLMLLAPPYTGIPNPDDPLTSNGPGTGENGGIFCHANTWAVIAECLLGRPERAWEYYRKILPAVAAAEEGQAHWRREPYVFNSSINGPAAGRDFGRGGISWLSGTASWMYIAATQYLLGLQPGLGGLRVRPCLPSAFGEVSIRRAFRGRTYRIEYGGKTGDVRVDGAPLRDGIIHA